MSDYFYHKRCLLLLLHETLIVFAIYNLVTFDIRKFEAELVVFILCNFYCLQYMNLLLFILYGNYSHSIIRP